MRARELAKLGYVAMALDMYGNGKIAEDPEDGPRTMQCPGTKILWLHNAASKLLLPW